jgi:hypothetical protein
MKSQIPNLRWSYGARVFSACAAMLGLCAVASGLAAQDIPYGVPPQPWPDSFGNHRARVRVEEKADAVWAHLAWRRRDREVEKKQILVVDAATGKEVPNVVRAAVARESGDLVFQPVTAPGEYHVYYLPFKVVPGVGGYSGNYLTARASSADPQWLGRHGLLSEKLPEGKWRALPQARVLEFQARTEFDRFDPMEVPATAEEMSRFLAAHAGRPYLVFPEDRRYPIRMTDELPRRWVENGPAKECRGQADRNEYYAFQVGVWASGAPVDDLAVEFADLCTGGGKTIPASALRCFNLGGTDWLGRPFKKTVSVAQGAVQALWFGVDVPRDARPGEYRCQLTLRPRGLEATTVALLLTVSDKVLEDRGDGEPWRHSRLRWLDSNLGMDDEVVAPFTPLAVEPLQFSLVPGTDLKEPFWRVTCLGRQVLLNSSGLPEAIVSNGVSILETPMTLALSIGGHGIGLGGRRFRMVKLAPGLAAWESKQGSPELSLTCQGQMELDGHLAFQVTLRAGKEIAFDDIAIDIEFRREVATYLMGFGRKGGLRPNTHEWKWGGKTYCDSGWIGDVPAGLQLELRGTTYSGPMVNLYWRLGQLKPPPAWDNGGKGGVRVNEAPDNGPVVLTAFTGPRHMEAGEAITLEFALLVTPVKPLDPAKHFRERYVHTPLPIPEIAKSGANVINVHHATPLNPYINYPFFATEKLAAYAGEAHEAGAKVKIYYTVRELTNHVTEMWALRSLGHEILAPGRGGGYPWLREHLASDYSPAWYHRFPDGDVCAAVVTSGESRWYNYYVEGLAWLLRNAGIDGLYLDDVTYDRNTLKRMRKIMERERPGCLIDLHSHRDFSGGPANQYMEFFPYIDRLWFGEGFDYDDPPDYWLVEISGIPFGLMGEMLQNGGNPWRGMLYGMTARLWYSGADPRGLWKLWDDFGISEARMMGYWDPACPVKTGRQDVLATAYVRPGRAIVAIASWAKEPARVRLAIDFQALGLDSGKARLRAPAVAGFQEAAEFGPGDEIPVPPGRGRLILIEPRL